ncbi:alpha/beta hydrolase [Asticcacaulis sp. 201]|uniref:alpha/beta hydrolase n=1 Tax=Asticcacaulis sp. 201 TaxID=3028787 RepID=UPI0029164B5E|nr:alpha/beta fold hydrolase [Asticcacaulis sp. 201]MDV6331726.1 alpha/beta hydrolase [Asticcacaulis sp. 201]
MTLRFRLLWVALLGLLATAFAAWLCAAGYLYINQRQILYANKADIDAPDIRGLPIEDVRIRTPDGETLQAWYEAPKPGQPVILFLHGQGASLHNGKWRYVRMHKQGVGYLALAYRGFSQSTGTPSEDGLEIDSLAAYDWLKAKGFKDSDIVIHGHSLGTGPATYLATQRPARALILEAPFTAASDVGAERYPYIPVAFLMKDKFLNRERIGHVHMPVLIAHGDRDSVVPFSDGEHLFALARSPKVFVRMRGSEHNTLTHDGVYPYYWRFLGLPETDVDPAIHLSK